MSEEYEHEESFLMVDDYEMMETEEITDEVEEGDYGFETELLDYNITLCHEDDEQLDVQVIDEVAMEMVKKQQLEDFLSEIEPISTAQRLAMFPEMRQLKAYRRRVTPAQQAFLDYSPPPPAFSSEKRTETEEFMQQPKVGKIGCVENSKALMCTACDYCYRSEQYLKTHQKLHDSEAEIPAPNFLCPFPECPVRCDCQATTNEHVRIHHKRDDLVYEDFYFSNYEEFERWKEGLEETTSSRFVRSSGRCNFTGRSANYSCFLASMHPAYQSRLSTGGVRQRTSRKLNRACTACLWVREIYGNVSVRACLTHCGHETHVQNIPLSTTIRKEIAAAIVQGEDEKTILENFRESSTPEDRRHYLQPYEIRNVFNKLAKNKYERIDHRRKNEEEKAPKEIKDIIEAPPFIAEEEVV